MTVKVSEQLRQLLASENLPDSAMQIDERDSGAVKLQLGYPLCEKLRSKLDASVEIEVKVEPHVARSEVKAISGIKNIIGIASGKGGVGKSTTALNLALALARMKVAVGLLDADVYGPSQPHMLGIKQKPELSERKKLIPIERHGLKTMSMGYLVAEETPMAWRGPMISSALSQMLNETEWGNLDYLIVDLPPGTGDIQLTLTKQTPLSAALIVTTPQDVALLDVRKAAALFGKMSIPVLGIVENMASHVCSECGHEENLFGAGGGARIAAELGIQQLAQIPLAIAVRQAGDSGSPLVEPAIQAAYALAATRMTAHLAARKKSYQHLFNNVIVEKE